MNKHTPSELRSKAEELLSEKQMSEVWRQDGARSPEAIQAILHNMEVHQIELELQNEDLRAAHAEIEAQRARYFDLYDQAPMGYVTVGAMGLIQEANLTAASLLGVNSGTLVRQPFTRFIFKEDQDLFYLHRKQVFESSILQTCELRMEKSDGTTIWVRLNGTAAKDLEGAPMFRVTLSDITERKKVEAALRNEHAMVVALMENLPDRIYFKDTFSRFLCVNPAFAAMHGLSSPEQAIGKSDADFFSAEHAQAALADEQMIMRTGQPILGLEEKETWPDGSESWVLTSKLPVRDSTGNIVGTCGISRDITERKMAENALRASMLRAEAANWAKSQFLANMSHEIRTPLNSVIGFTDLLQDTPLDATQMEFVKFANQSGISLLNIINEIMDFSKIEAGMLTLETVKTDMRELLQNSMSVIKLAADEKNLSVILDIDRSMPRYSMVDPHRLKQILINLLGNAVKFTDKGMVEFKVGYEPMGGAKGKFSFSIRDTGIGIAEEHRERIFEYFSQADDSTTRKYGGTGLGLTISARLAEKMGSKIRLTSTLGQGSVFFFDLITETVLGEEKEGSVADALPGWIDHDNHSKASLGSRRTIILTVEDNHTSALLLKYLLTKLMPRAEIIEATDGREALDLYKSKEVDLVFMDVQMPEMDGFDATKEIRAHDESGSRRVPIVALTAGAFRKHREKCLAAGMDEILTKPIDPVKLKSTLEKYLEKQV